ncbi:hypothetical protein ACW2Q0_04730 [Nocardia sp. R16R-3T]
MRRPLRHLPIAILSTLSWLLATGPDHLTSYDTLEQHNAEVFVTRLGRGSC